MAHRSLPTQSLAYLSQRARGCYCEYFLFGGVSKSPAQPLRPTRPSPFSLSLSPLSLSLLPSLTPCSGYDLGITGGITAARPFLTAFFPAVAARQAAAEGAPPPDPVAAAYCKFDDPLLTFFTSSAFLAAAAASLFAGDLSRRAGRRAVLVAAGFAFLAGTGLTAGAVHVSMLVAGRLLLGVGIGLANAAAPTFLAEVAPTHRRAACGICFQLGTTFAVLASQAVNFVILGGGAATAADSAWARHGWRLAMGLAALPAAGLTAGAFLVSDSPASLAYRGREAEGWAALARLRGGGAAGAGGGGGGGGSPGSPPSALGAAVEAEWQSIRAAAAEGRRSAVATRPWTLPFARRLRPELIMACAVAAGSQLNGINAILFYVAPTAASLGASARGALGAAVAVGGALWLGTFVSIFTADRLGRRPLLIQGGVQMLVCEVGLAAVLARFMGREGAGGPGGPALPPRAAAASLALMCFFVLGFSWSWGPLGWVIPAEVWPLEARAAGQVKRKKKKGGGRRMGRGVREGRRSRALHFFASSFFALSFLTPSSIPTPFPAPLPPSGPHYRAQLPHRRPDDPILPDGPVRAALGHLPPVCGFHHWVSGHGRALPP